MPTFEFGTFVNVVCALGLLLYLTVQSDKYPNPHGGTHSDLFLAAHLGAVAVLAAALLRTIMVQSWPQAPGIEILAGVTEIAACIFLLTVLTARLRDQLRFNRAGQELAEGLARDLDKDRQTGA